MMSEINDMLKKINHIILDVVQLKMNLIKMSDKKYKKNKHHPWSE